MNVNRPSPLRQYRLRYQRGLDISRLVSRAPHGEDDRRRRGVALDLLAEPLHQRIDAAYGYERLVLPDAAQQRIPAENDPGVREQHLQELELIRGEVDVPRSEERRVGKECR